MTKVSVILTHPGHIAGEPIRGYVTVKTKQTKMVKNVYVNIFGKSHTFFTVSSGEGSSETIGVNNDVYRSPPISVIDERHGTNSNLEQELAPGIYTFPFVVAFPDNLPSSTSIGNGRVLVWYYINGTIAYSNNTGCSSDSVIIPMCITPKKKPPQPVVMSDSVNGVVEFKLSIADNFPAVGDSVQLNLSCTNHSNQYPVKLSLHLMSVHDYQNTHFSVSSPSVTFIEVPPRSASSINGALIVPIDMPTTTQHQGFNISTYLVVTGKGAAPFERVAPPSYSDIIRGNLPKGIEKIVSEDDDVEYYINHFNRTTSLLPDTHAPCNFPYPLYNSALLPSGWSIASSPSNERFIPHICHGIKGKLKVEVLKAVGLCALGKNVPNPYVGMIGADDKMVKTNSYKGKLDIKFDKKNKLEVELLFTRTNVIIYVFDKCRIGSDVFMGGVNIDLQYFPPDVIVEDWFGLSCFGDKSITVTGKLLLRVCYRVDHNIDTPLISIKGHSSLNHPYYPNSLPMREQIKKQQQMRTKYKMGDSPMINYEGVLMCRSN
ncbi:WW domain-containing protein [Entamoeba marina]